MNAKAAKTAKRRPAKSIFSTRILALLRESRMLAVRAGSDHRFIGIWFVMVGDRVFVRPYYDELTGWYRAFQKDPRGAIALGKDKREIAVRARTASGSSLFDAVDAAYASKYATKASLKWVRGFHQARRRKTTTELRPR
jgi:hypothetical protein